MKRFVRWITISLTGGQWNLRLPLCLARGALGLVGIAGMAQAEGRWLAPTNGWDHNYVAIAGSGAGKGVPTQFSTLWKASAYQTGNSNALNYVAIIPDAVEGDVLMLTHTNSSPYYYMSSGPGAGTTNDLITLDCRFRLADESQSMTQAQFMVSVVRPRLDGTTNGWNQWVCLVSKQELKVNAATISVDLGSDWHTVRLVADVARNSSSVYLDNNPLPIYNGPSTLYPNANKRNWTAFGDSGGVIDGKAQVKYIRWTTNELVNPLTFLHAGAGDPVAEGFTYKPENLDYAASNNLLPEAATLSWSKSGFPLGTTWMTNDEVTGEAALHMVLTNTSGVYTQSKESGRFTTNDLVDADFRFRLVDDSQAEGHDQIQMSLVGPRPDNIGGQQMFYLRFAKDRIRYFNNSGTLAEYPAALGTNWHNVNWQVNWNTRDADVYLDNNPVKSFSHKSRLQDTPTNNYTAFGDGSASIDGIVRLSHLRVTRQTLTWQGGADADATPYWQGVDSDGSYGFYEGAVPAVVMTNAQGWTASCKLRVPQASADALGVTMRCCDNANRWSLSFTPGAYAYQNADGSLVQLGSSTLAGQYHTFQMYYDPAGDSNSGTVSYYKNGWLIQTLTRAEACTNGSSTNLFQWGCDSVPLATSTQRWNFVEFAPGNRVIAPIPRDGTSISVR